METTSHLLHAAFTFNGLSFTESDLLAFAKKLEAEGDDHEMSAGRFIRNWLDDSPTINVNTSGSTGKPKTIKLDKEKMVNSAKATGAYFSRGQGTSALLCLSADYIAGMMMLTRAMVLGWDLHVVAPEKDALVQYDNPYDFVAMVPYQVRHSMHALNKVKTLIIGGAPVTRELEQELQHVTTEAFATYGMTETISHVAIRRLNGTARSSTFTALPEVTFTQDDRDCLVIYAPQVADREVVTNDIVDLHSEKSFTWLGRHDYVINSGGIKIHPEKIEEKLSDHIDLPFIVASIMDKEWGERVILVVENLDEQEVPDYTEHFALLEKHERPKRIFTVSRFPYTPTGKIKRGDILQMLKKYKR